MVDDPYVMYLVVRKDLVKAMGVGKTSGQVGHAVMMLMVAYLPDRDGRLEETDWCTTVPRHAATRRWLTEDYPSYPKIVLAASDDEFALVKQENDPHFLVIDRGRTILPENTETVVGLWPCRKSEASLTVKTLKPLR